jgi:tetratricopeptide (TPR) repeat protein
MPMTPPSVPGARAARAIASTTMAGFPGEKRGTHFEIGMYLKEHGEVDGALVEFLKSTQENPRLARGFYEQAVIFRERNYLKLAESSLQQALTAEPDYQKAQILLAMIRLQQGEFMQAASGLSKILNIAPPKFLPISGMVANKSGQAATGSNSSGTNNNGAAQAQVNPGQPATQAVDSEASLASNQSVNAEPVHSDITKEMAPAPASSSNSFLNDLLKGIPGIDPAVPSGGAEQSAAHKSQDAAASDLVASLVGSSPRPSSQAQAPTAEAKDAPQAKRSKGFRLFFFNPFASEEDSGEASAMKQMPKPVKIRLARQKKVKVKPQVMPKAAYRTAADQARGADGSSKGSNKRRWFGKFFGGSDNSASAIGQVSLPPDAKVTEVPIKKDNDPYYSAMLMPTPKVIPSSAPQVRSNISAQDSRSQVRQTNQLIIGSGPANAQAGQVVSQVRSQAGIVTRQAPPQAEFAAPKVVAAPLSYLDAATKSQENKAKPKVREFETGIQKSQAIAQAKSEASGQAEDAWTLKLRDLALHGTDSLKGGEAFMFSEETGDATLFLSNGQIINRHVLPPRDPDEVAKARRPDMSDPKGLQYNLSLLGKLLPRTEKQAGKPSQEPGITLNDLSKKSDNAWGWFRQTLNF